MIFTIDIFNKQKLSSRINFKWRAQCRRQQRQISPDKLAFRFSRNKRGQRRKLFCIGEFEFTYTEELSPLTALVPGKAEGELVGGNLSLLTSTLGTPFEIDTRGKLLFIEDINCENHKLEFRPRLSASPPFSADSASGRFDKAPRQYLQ